MNKIYYKCKKYLFIIIEKILKFCQNLEIYYSYVDDHHSFDLLGDRELPLNGLYGDLIGLNSLYSSGLIDASFWIVSFLRNYCVTSFLSILSTSD